MTATQRPEPVGGAAPAAASLGDADRVLDEAAVRGFVAEQLAAADLDGYSVCALVPDATRTCPLPVLLGAVHEALAGRVSRLTVLVALGTHAPLEPARLARHLGYAEAGERRRYPGTAIAQHEWWRPETYTRVGTVSAQRVAELSGGLLRRPVEVQVNRAVVEHDVTLVLGPVFPHEVAGFSGGTKYLFPGVAGPDVIDLSHWLGALITSAEIIGTQGGDASGAAPGDGPRGGTPVRALIDAAADLVPSRQLGLCAVVDPAGGGLHAVSFGELRAAWAASAAISARAHIRYLDAPVPRVLSLIPERYQDLWTGAKGFYKVEPVVADGGEVILYAPHIRELSRMHPEIARIGYHCRDFFLRQWDRYGHLRWAELAHSTHLRGAGSYDSVAGERCRVTVTLASSIPEAEVRAANLAYLDPASVDVSRYRADPDTLVVPDAGEILYRLR